MSAIVKAITKNTRKKRKYDIPFTVTKSSEVTVIATSKAEALQIARKMTIRALKESAGENSWCVDYDLVEDEEDIIEGDEV